MKGEKYTSLDCVTQMASRTTISQQGLAQVDKAAARILGASQYSLYWDSCLEHLLCQINTESIFGLSKTFFPVVKETTVNCACPVGQARRQLSLYFFLQNALICFFFFLFEGVLTASLSLALKGCPLSNLNEPVSL